MLLECERDAELRHIFESSSLNIPESSGLSLVANIKGVRPFEKLPGIDLMLKLCEEAAKRGWTVFLIGAKPGRAEEAKAKLVARFPGLQIAGTAHGYLKGEEENQVLKSIRSLKPHFLFVAMTIPNQEKWIARNSGFFQGTCVMGVGGSFDVLSGHLVRAPKIFRNLGLEWLYRWVQEPWRTRRILQLPLFLIKALIHAEKASPQS